jgi:hypothetical protein
MVSTGTFVSVEGNVFPVPPGNPVPAVAVNGRVTFNGRGSTSSRSPSPSGTASSAPTSSSQSPTSRSTRRVGSPAIGSETSSEASETTETTRPKANPRYHHCSGSLFYIGTGGVITEIECGDCGRVWTLESRTDEEGHKVWFWKPDPEPAEAAVKRRQAIARARAAKAKKKAAPRTPRGA